MKKPVDILEPKTWRKFTGLKMCKGCTAGCCTLPVVVNSEDLFHMGFLKAHEVEGPLKRAAERLKKKGIVKIFREKSRTFILETKNGHDCIFLDEKRLCKIYDRRPYICRRFPENAIRPGYCPAEQQVKKG